MHSMQQQHERQAATLQQQLLQHMTSPAQPSPPPSRSTWEKGLPLLLRAMLAPAVLATGLACSFRLERRGSCLKEPTPTPRGPSVMAEAALARAGPDGWPPSRNMEGGAAMVGVVAA